MNKFDEMIIFILLKICKILAKYGNKDIDTMIITIEMKLKELRNK